MKFFNDGYINSQKYLECQIVTIINAAIHLGEEAVHPYSEEYERLIDIGGARYGAAIRPEYVMDYLRVETVNTDPGWETLTLCLDNGNPVEYGISHPGVGFHSVLVVGYTIKDSKRMVRVINLSQATDDEMWMDWEKFKESWYFLSNWEARYFRLHKQREYQLLQKELDHLNYPKRWFHKKLKELEDKTPYELFSSGRDGLEKVKQEIQKRIFWDEDKRLEEIRKIKNKENSEK